MSPTQPAPARTISTLGGKMAINRLEAIQVSDAAVDPHPRADASNPVLLLIQQGPGLPMMNEARRFKRLLGLEQAFTVVYWDQRGCGRSLRGRSESADISLEQLVSDTVSMLEVLGQALRKAHRHVELGRGTRRPELDIDC